MQVTPYIAPSFALKSQDGSVVNLTDFKGKWLVLYFYPKDDTPGCTIEACSFRDGRDEITEKTGAEIIGISRDDEESHQKFIKHHRLTFKLLSDPDATVIKAYGAWGKTMFGKEGILRKTFLIDPNGMVRKVYGKVIPTGHAGKVLKDLLQLQHG